jgi:hypothetical protein
MLSSVKPDILLLSEMKWKMDFEKFWNNITKKKDLLQPNKFHNWYAVTVILQKNKWGSKKLLMSHKFQEYLKNVHENIFDSECKSKI